MRPTSSEPTTSSPAAAPTSGSELPKAYRPAEHEGRIRDRWFEARAFSADPGRVVRGEAKPYSILIPPPNVTARLHLGHALNNTLQDVLVRAHRMMGYETLWMPGTDHAGIATQAVVERRLREEGTLKGPLKDAFTREQFVAKVQAWKDDYEKQITDQLKLMGCSCDYDRQRFTMDEICARAVREAFFRLFRDGLIYRGKRLVNWDPALQTAVADDECYEEEVQTSFWYLRYPLVVNKDVPVTWGELAGRGYPGAGEHPAGEQAWVTVATTRPETYLADTAVALNPNDPRLPALKGLSVQLPIVGRVIPIIDDAYVVLPESMARTEEEKNDPKAKYATGFLKVTPGHDENDYQVYQRHQAAIDAAVGNGLLNMMSPDGRVSDEHGWTDVGGAGVFVGLTMAEARKAVVAAFKERGQLEAVKPYTQVQTFSDRSKAQVEPFLSDQWYVRVTDPRLAANANAALVPGQRSVGGTALQSGGPRASRDQERHTALESSATKGIQGKAEGDGEMTFVPARYAKTFEHWHENIRDWCISRQLWWGHRIPVWHANPRDSNGFPSFWLQKDSYCQKLTERISLALKAARVAGGVVIVPHPTDSSFFICSNCPEVDAELDRYFVDASESPIDLTGGSEVMKAVLAVREMVHDARQDPDVLDTWFSSALWPLSTMGWPDSDRAAAESGDGSMKDLLAAFNPTSTLCTAREIITLWVSRMTMFNRYFRDGTLPFRDVYIHAVVQDGEGQKMSKSLGNGVDPIDIIETHGSDAMRFTLCQIATQTQDVRLPVDILDPHTGEAFTPKMVTNERGDRVAAPIQEYKGKKMVSSYGVASGSAKPTAEMPVARNTSSKFDFGRNFANKLWNASRFTLSMLDRAGGAAGGVVAESKPEAVLADGWILSRLARATEEIGEAIRNYEFANYAQALYRFIWDDFCDWYLEAIKPTVAEDARQRATLAAALRGAISLAHPVMPFITEVIWEQLSSRLGGLHETPGVSFEGSRKGGLLCTAGWPRLAGSVRNDAVEQRFDRVKALITGIREVRAQHNVPPKRKVTLHVPDPSAWSGAALLVQTLAGVDEVRGMGGEGARVRFMFEGAECALSNLADAVDAEAERARLTKLIADKQRSIATLEGRLANPGYAAKAPPAMVKQTQDQLSKDKADLEAAQAALAGLGG
jgi:valyl-tRNA synthetase